MISIKTCFEDEAQALGADMDNLFRLAVSPKDCHPTFAGLWHQRNPWNECVIADWAMGFQKREELTWTIYFGLPYRPRTVTRPLRDSGTNAILGMNASSPTGRWGFRIATTNLSKSFKPHSTLHFGSCIFSPV